MQPPTNVDEISSISIVTIGSSSISQSNMVEAKKGMFSVYRFTDKVLSANQLDSSLDQASVIIYDVEEVEDNPSLDILRLTFKGFLMNL